MELELMTTDEVAKLFNISKATVFRYIEAGYLKAAKVGRNYYFTPEDVKTFMAQGGKPRKQRKHKTETETE